ncbi:TDE2712 family protein [Natronincola ferrireducens]|uniref:Uncharacterized protein n=1 Tax=Natronincola ferrireducens TaxID=393762 RepID=A0A1G8ZBD8_9FIRM|nr:hypothetical protein [Natronincola ferrireducens]SDK12328.1 hypothetical protein SAMN05660472_00799 [Natronincola ferrireducens]
MIKRIKVKLNIIEGMLYYWQATSEKEKVGESYIINMAELPEMAYIYDDEFNKESVRKVLSAISNREILNSESRKERKFWNNNMWMLEDLEYTNMMIAPLKTLNLDGIIEKLNNQSLQSKDEELEVLFIPGHHDEYLIADNKLVINFFRVKADLYEENKVTIGDTPLVDYIQEKLTELIKK